MNKDIYYKTIEALFNKSTNKHYWIPVGEKLLRYLLEYIDNDANPAHIIGLYLDGYDFYKIERLGDWEMEIQTSELIADRQIVNLNE